MQLRIEVRTSKEVVPFIAFINVSKELKKKHLFAVTVRTTSMKFINSY